MTAPRGKKKPAKKATKKVSQKRKPVAKDEGGLTEKQEAFAYEYVANGFNATAAYRKVYDTTTENASSIWRMAFAVRHNVNVASRIEEIKQEALRAKEISIERVVEEYARLGFSSAMDYIEVDPETGEVRTNLKGLDRNTAAAINEIEVKELTNSDGDRIGFATKIKLSNKKDGLDGLAKYLNMFEKHEKAGAGRALSEEGEKKLLSDMELARRMALRLMKPEIVKQIELDATVKEAPDDGNA